jgi:D-alanine-D-alanine ligase
VKYAIVFGAKSYEHEISIVSAISLSKNVKADFVFIFCHDERDFYLIPKDKLKSTLFSSGEYKKQKPLTLQKGGFFQKGLLGESKLEVDVFINLIHGLDGEDGKIASLFEFYSLKFISPRVEASVVSFNKEITKLYAKSKDIDVIEYEIIKRGQKPTFDFPIILKPLRLGSSIGLSVVKSQNELDYALDLAFEFDTEVLVEPFYKDIKEYNLAGCKSEKGFVFSIIEEPQKKDLLDFETKYLDFSRDSEAVEANLSDELKSKIKSSFEKIYDSLFEGAIIRCDFFVKDNRVYLNEINPIPGSLAWYLFEDFESVLDSVANSLPAPKYPNIKYEYINSIKASKGKL